MDSLKGWEQRLEVWFGKYLVNSQRGPQHCIFLSSLIEKYQNKELDRFVSFLWVPVEKKLFFIHTVRNYSHSTAATEFVTSATEFVMSSEASNQQYFSHFSTFRFLLGFFLHNFDKYSWKGEKSTSFPKANR